METGLNNTDNTVNKTQFNDFIHSCFDTVSLRMVKSEERRLYSLAKIHWNSTTRNTSNAWMQSCTESYYSIEYSIRVQWPSAVGVQYKIMKQLKLPLEFKAYWSLRITSDVTCFETYKNLKPMHCDETWINLIYIDQGHPTTVFCELSVRRSKYCLEFSNTWGRLKIARWLTTHAQFSKLI